MVSWKTRIRTYKTFGALPHGARLFDLYRRLAGSSRRFDLGKREYTVREMALMLQESGKCIDGAIVAEIGSGWHPVLPSFFFALGAERIHMTDVQPYIRDAYVHQTIDFVAGRADRIAGVAQTSPSVIKARVNMLRPNSQSWIETWKMRGIEYHAPFDFRNTGWDPDSIDCIFSNSCICYIPQPDLTAIFAESTRVLNKGGFVAHNVSVYDDYSADRSIDAINFLRYSADEWDRIGNTKLHYQNRLRPADYERMAAAAGLRVIYAERVPHPTLDPASIDRSQLHSDFRDLPEEELTCAHFLMVAEKV